MPTVSILISVYFVDSSNLITFKWADTDTTWQDSNQGDVIVWNYAPPYKTVNNYYLKNYLLN